MTKTQAVTKTQHPDFSFATVNVTKRGAHLETDWFDVPATDVFSNNGLLAFGELMQVIADKQPRNGLVSRNVIEAAARATGAPVLAGKSQRWAAMHFMNILCDALVFLKSMQIGRRTLLCSSIKTKKLVSAMPWSKKSAWPNSRGAALQRERQRRRRRIARPNPA